MLSALVLCKVSTRSPTSRKRVASAGQRNLRVRSTPPYQRRRVKVSKPRMMIVETDGEPAYGPVIAQLVRRFHNRKRYAFRAINGKHVHSPAGAAVVGRKETDSRRKSPEGIEWATHGCVAIKRSQSPSQVPGQAKITHRICSPYFGKPPLTLRAADASFCLTCASSVASSSRGIAFLFFRIPPGIHFPDRLRRLRWPCAPTACRTAYVLER